MTIVLKIKEAEVLIDDIDSDLLKWGWHIHVAINTGQKYVRTNSKRVNGKMRLQMMHRIILARKIGRELLMTEFCDHADGNTFNNQRSNLRLATRSQNNANSRTRKNNRLGVKGVRQVGKRFRAVIHMNGELIHLGYFDTVEQAHEAYLRKAKELHGEFANGG